MRHSSINRRGLIIKAYVFAVALSVLLSIFIISFKSDAKDCEYIYRSVRIEDGDTLNSLASRFLAYSGVSNHGDYVKQISRVNRLSSDKIIVGAYLVIPILDTVE